MRRFAITMLLVVACGGGTDATTDGEDAADGSVVSTVVATVPTNAPDDGVETLADFVPEFGFNFDDREAAQADYLRREQEAQELIRECMAAEGFDYIPFVPEESATFFGPFGDLSEEEFAEHYGFGFTTLYVEEPGLADPEGYNDPNDEIVQDLDEATREEYYRVLHGEEPDVDFETMTDEEIDAYFEDFVPTGCYAEAQREVNGSQRFFEDFSDELQEMWEEMQTDPRVVAAQADWSACMAEAGHQFADQDAMYEYLQQRIDEIVTYNEPSPEQVAELEQEFGPAGPTEEQMAEMDTLFGPQYDEAELKALNEEEISMAVADLDCRNALMDTFDEVQKEFEARFVAEHRDALEAYRNEG